MRYLSSILVLLALLITASSGCEKEEPFVNPYDDPSLDPPVDTVQETTHDPNSIIGIHANVFSKTCANSGCHDGTFEPDFRSIESTYNTLIFAPLIKNDNQNSYTYRVLPGDADNSILYQRLIVDIDGQSGIMPLAVDPDSDWDTRKSEYIQNIRNWINEGAKDMFGNTPQQTDIAPHLKGMAGYPAGSSTRFDRQPGKGPIEINTTGLVELWFALSDPETPTPSLTYNKVLFSTNLNDFSGAQEIPLTIESTPKSIPGYFGPAADHYHKVIIDPSTFPQGQTVFVRVRVQDNGANFTELPNEDSPDYLKEYAAFVVL